MTAHLTLVCHDARMKRQLPWLIAMPLAVVGTLAGHSAGYLAAVPDAHERSHVLAASGHGYLHVRAARARALRRARRARVRRARAGCLQRTRIQTGGTRITLVAGVAPAAFVLQELVERYLHDGHLHWAARRRPRRSCSDWRCRCRSRSWRPPSPTPWQPRAQQVAAAIRAARLTAAAQHRARVPVLALDRSSVRARPRSQPLGTRPSASRLAAAEAADLGR